MYIDSPNISGSLTITGSLFLNGTAVTASGGGGGTGAGFPYSGSAVITGSLYVSGGNISGSFVGNGAGLTGIPTASFALTASYAPNVSIDQFATYEDTFTNVPSHSAVHNFGTKNVFVQVFESDDTLLIPYSVTTTTANQVDIVFGDTLSGRVVIGKAGHILQDTGNFVSSSTAVATFTNATTASINHYLDSFNVITQVFDSNNNVIVPSNIKVSTKDKVDITFSTPRSGKAVIAKAGHIVSGSAINATSASFATTATSASFATTAERVRAGDSGSRPTDYVNIATGSLWYNTNTLALEVFTGVSGSWWTNVAPTFKATGGSITTSGAYTYHHFTSSGTFEVTSGQKDIDVLVVGGGGSGGFGHGAGGGGGSVLYKTNRSTVIGQYDIVIGGGGTTATSDADDNPGTSTTAFDVTATGGGSGANETGNDSSGRSGVGGAGANGGGGSYENKAGGTGTAPSVTGWTVYAGNDGAAGGAPGAPYICGGGGGAGTAGSAGSQNGANGIQIDIDGNNYYWGGGGGGATYDGGSGNPGGNGGLGGGGGGSVDGGTLVAGSGGGSSYNTGGNGSVGSNLVGGSGGANTGGGGGGGSNENGNGGSGGSGIVIIRYLTN